MRMQSFVTVATAIVSTVLLSACSGGVSQGTNAGLPSTGASQSKGLSDPARSGIAPKFLGMVPHGHAIKRGVTPAFTNHVIYLNDSGTNVVDVIKYNHWTTFEGTISSGMNGVDGNWVDKPVGGVRHLYVANYINPNITEYDTAGNLVFTYSTGIADSIGVTTDKNGNVFEADLNYTVSGGGYVNEYAQQSNTVMATCSPGGNVEGVAVDKHGNVFVDYNLASGGAAITEYVGGLTASGCTGTVLPITLGYAGGMVLDKRGELVVCDQIGTGSGAVVDIIPSPYTSITGTLGSGWVDPFHVTIDMAGSRAYVTDLGAADVSVLTYPGGSPIATINSTEGLSQPSSTVDEHNLVVDSQGP
jgi:hypothetical protein